MVAADVAVDSSVWSSSSWARSVMDEVSVVVLTSLTVDRPPPAAAAAAGSAPVSALSSLPLPTPGGDRADDDVLPLRSTGGVSMRSYEINQ